jgi:phosphonate transport system permease protein
MAQANIEEQSSQLFIERKGNNKIKIRKWTKPRIWLYATFSVLIAITLYQLIFMEYSTNFEFVDAFSHFLRDLRRMFLDPTFSGRFSMEDLLSSLWITIGLGVLTTLIGAVIAFFFALGAARNLSTPWLSDTIRVIMSIFRAIPTILWVMVFGVVASLGSEAAIVGMAFHSVAYLVKAYSESFEELDEGIIEALRASGASWWQIVFQAVLPSSISSLLSWTFIRFEINFMNAIAVGAAAGAGGIGYELFMAGNFYFDINEIGVIVYASLITAAVLEFISFKLRERYIVND